MEMKLGGEKVHIKLMWELLTLVTVVFPRIQPNLEGRLSLERLIALQTQFSDLSCVPSITTLEVRLSKSQCGHGAVAFSPALLLLLLSLGIVLGNMSMFWNFSIAKLLVIFMVGKIAWRSRGCLPRNPPRPQRLFLGSKVVPKNALECSSGST